MGNSHIGRPKLGELCFKPKYKKQKLNILCRPWNIHLQKKRRKIITGDNYIENT